MSLSAKIKNQFGSLKHYAKLRKLNYASLRAYIAGRTALKTIEKQLIKDGFIKDIKEIA